MPRSIALVRSRYAGHMASFACGSSLCIRPPDGTEWHRNADHVGTRLGMSTATADISGNSSSSEADGPEPTVASGALPPSGYQDKYNVVAPVMPKSAAASYPLSLPYISSGRVLLKHNISTQAHSRRKDTPGGVQDAVSYPIATISVRCMRLPQHSKTGDRTSAWRCVTVRQQACAREHDSAIYRQSEKCGHLESVGAIAFY